VKHVFNYDPDCKGKGKWSHQPLRVKIDTAPFARGGLRMVYHMLEEKKGPGTRMRMLAGQDKENETPTKAIQKRRALYGSGPLTAVQDPCVNKPDREFSLHGTPSKAPRGDRNKQIVSYVAKMAIDPFEDDDIYLRDVEMQAHCQHYAAKFNMYDPPQHVQFVKAWVLELIERENKPLVGVERFIEGEYVKHNNNFGWKEDEDSCRNTPQAFSHFTYEASNHEMIVVDIQGVGDLYTDPQIHTMNGKDFGRGNLGEAGIKKFLETHRCNHICRYLKLQAINPKDDDQGTKPADQYMAAQKIETAGFDSQYYYLNNPNLKERIKSREGSPTSSPCGHELKKMGGHDSTSCSFCNIL